MRTFLLSVICSILSLTAFSQNPTLAVGLEMLTMNKGSIDVDVLTEIILEKQKELKQEAMKRFMLSLFPETNYTTRFYIQNSLNILLNEKNPHVIKKEILELTTNYALVLGVAKYYSDKSEITNINTYFAKHRLELSPFIAREFTLQNKGSNKLAALRTSLDTARKNVAMYAKKHYKEGSDYKKNLLALETKRIEAEAAFRRRFISEGLNLGNVENVDKLPFGLLTDVVAGSLSGMKELKDKGFFRKPINYRNDNFYLGLLSRSDSEDYRFANKLVELQDSITNQIRPYIANYDVIKEFFSVKQDMKKNTSIKQVLTTNYVNSILKLAGGVDGVKAILTNKDLGGLNINITDAYNRLDDLLELQKTIESYRNNLHTINSFYAAIARLKEKNTQESQDSIKQQLSAQLRTTETSLDSSIKSTINQFNSLRNDVKIQLNKQKIVAPSQPEELDLAKVNIILTNIETGSKALGDSLLTTANEMIKNGDLLNMYLSNLLGQMSSLENFKVSSDSILLGSEIVAYSSMLAQIFIKLNQFNKQEIISLKDINYIDQEVIPNFIKYSVIFTNDAQNFSKVAQNFRLLSALLKIKAITNVGAIEKYDKELSSLFSFIANLDNLDHAESYQDMLNLFQYTNVKLEESLQSGKFKDIYRLFSNAVSKYTIINTQEQFVSIDVISFLTELQQYVDRNNPSNFGLYLTIGLNENFFLNTVYLPGSTNRLRNLGLASEKLGLKFRLRSFSRYKGYENTISGDVNLNKRAPFVNQLYAIIYGSGLLYSLANTSTNTNFDYPHVGGGFGLRFYNALDINAIVGVPFMNERNIFKNAFIGIGFDIPFGEYLEKLGKKNH